jgi:two-component system, cell cycle sensor histidine kinase and response regulator CckA
MTRFPFGLWRYTTAADGVEALEVHRRHKDRIQAVILDLGLPKLSGWETFVQIRKRDPALRVIFTSGYAREMLGDGRPIDDSAFLPKPYPPQRLVALVH